MKKRLILFLVLSGIGLIPGIAFGGCGYVTDEQGFEKYVCDDDDRLPRYGQPLINRSFNGYPCTVDCSGHEAGYNWAIRNGITDPAECTGNSLSFVEGCRSAAGE